ncbi:hypothetical protein ETD86_32690 [Nonomuraea turkmeniaca]|uniref:Uncharacterized protein n=1 Tax=Nonomuraea turkmeniaca TaxID=103838 RepID=A0A5S4FSF4_9ACTN|nr:hypothetical protein [Nonomuraea turkmeniaca]TMR12409.1 hypothetical protein ETD86_32690 [Nonomuraea turkmeniaca]
MIILPVRNAGSSTIVTSISAPASASRSVAFTKGVVDGAPYGLTGGRRESLAVPELLSVAGEEATEGLRGARADGWLWLVNDRQLVAG